MSIHPLSLVSPQARLGRDVVIGPYAIVEADAEIGDRCELASGAVVKSGVTLGPDNRVMEGAVIGGPPQHVQMPPKIGRVVIGRGNVFRENCTIHRALHEGATTTIGDNNLLMVGTHIAHDCQVGNNVIFANNVLLAGHVAIEDRAFVSGAVGIHQFCRIGRLAMLGGHARVVQDVPPFVTVDGTTGCIVGLNLVGLRRNGYAAADIAELKAAYRLIYRSGLKFKDMLRQLEVRFSSGPAAVYFPFLTSGTRASRKNVACRRGLRSNCAAPPTTKRRKSTSKTAKPRANAGSSGREPMPAASARCVAVDRPGGATTEMRRLRVSRRTAAEQGTVPGGRGLLADRGGGPLAGFGGAVQADGGERLQLDHFGQAHRHQLRTANVAAWVDPLGHLRFGDAEHLGQQLVHVGFQATEVARPFGGFGQADMLFALPFHGMKQQDTVGGHQPAAAGGERPQGGRRAFAGHDARCLDAAQHHQRHERHGAVGAAAGELIHSVQWPPGGTAKSLSVSSPSLSVRSPTRAISIGPSEVG